MEINIVKATFTLYWPNGQTQKISRHLLDHDVEWVAKQFVEVNGLTKITFEVDGKTHTIESTKEH